MSGSAPSDLAVTFRSVTRRRREAQGDAPPDVTAALQSDIDRQLVRAGQLVGAPADPALIADAIDAVRADQWDASALDELRNVALDLGRTIRSIEDLARIEG